MKEVDCCYGCSRRYVGCHGECETYKAIKANNDREREAYLPIYRAMEYQSIQRRRNAITSFKKKRR